MYEIYLEKCFFFSWLYQIVLEKTAIFFVRYADVKLFVLNWTQLNMNYYMLNYVVAGLKRKLLCYWITIVLMFWYKSVVCAKTCAS